MNVLLSKWHGIQHRLQLRSQSSIVISGKQTDMHGFDVTNFN